MGFDIDSKLNALADKGVVIIDPRQTYVSREVDIDRIYKGSVLYPGARLTGSRTLVGTNASVGTEGPATLHDSIIGAGAEVASGFLTETTMLPGAKAGANSHFRRGTLLEEEASTAHCVGLKQSILMHSVTLGSLINFCDILISGGRSRNDHTEVGSGFIHFNFTPWGRSGDKATPSLIGNVTEGVFLDRERIFLGGLSGAVGPLSVGYGAVTVAGQVIRKSVPDSTLHSEAFGELDAGLPVSGYRPSGRHLSAVRENNIEFISQLYALLAWYENVRLRRSRLAGDIELSLVLEGAMETILACIDERFLRYNSFAEEWSEEVLVRIDPGAIMAEVGAAEVGAAGVGATEVGAAFPDSAVDSIIDRAPEMSHDEWVRGLAAPEKDRLHGWLAGYADVVRNAL